MAHRMVLAATNIDTKSHSDLLHVTIQNHILLMIDPVLVSIYTIIAILQYVSA